MRREEEGKRYKEGREKRVEGRRGMRDKEAEEERGNRSKQKGRGRTEERRLKRVEERVWRK